MANDFLNSLKAESNQWENTRNEIINEIVNEFNTWVANGGIEKYLKSHISNQDKQARQSRIFGEFWAYHSGCSGTHFYIGGWTWKTPGVPEYDYRSHSYRGIHLIEIQDDVLRQLTRIYIGKLLNMGFTVADTSSRQNNLGYTETNIIIKW
jgi:hypothetical protein